jgi:hypothetical protein
VAFDVTGVTLEQVTMPLFGPEYIRYPVQVGDLGACFPVDVYLGGISGLGGGTADDTLQGNLSTLVWFPIASKNWSAEGIDPNALTLYGPNGVVLKDQQGLTVATLTSSGWVLNAQTNITLQTEGGTSIAMNSTAISLSSNGHTIVINADGVVIDGKIFLLHDHTLVQTGSGISGPVGP